MPVILDEAGTASVTGGAALRPAVTWSPKDYNTILTGNGVNQGLLRASLPVSGTDPVPQNIAALLRSEYAECQNRARHVLLDDRSSYTVLWQDISLCRGWAPDRQNHRNRGTPAPMCIMTDRLASFRDTATGKEIVFRSRLFLNRIYVYKGTVNCVLPSLFLIAAPEDSPRNSFAESCDTLLDPGKYQDPVRGLYGAVMENMKKEAALRGWECTGDDSAALADDDASRSMYDMIMSELALIKTPGTLKNVLQSASMAGYSILSAASRLLSLVTVPFTLYQSDVIDVINSRSPEDAARLKNENMSLSLADTLSTMQSCSSQTIPELVGKHYSTDKMNLTAEQLTAIESPSRITVVAAGAGTGKSSCIMHRLAFMEENGCDMRHTFVLSFTKAAAGHIKKNFRDCRASTIAEFTHSFVNVILDDGSGARLEVVAHSDFVQKLKIQASDLSAAGILPKKTEDALARFVLCAERIETSQSQLLNMLDRTLNPEAGNILSVLKTLHCTSLEIDPVIFYTQLAMVQPNIEHIVIDESQDSNRLEFLTMLKMAIMHNISIYIVGDCAQTLYEFRDADPRILNNLTKLFSTCDLSINHRSTQIILDVANLMSSTMTTHSTVLRSNQIMNVTKQAVDDTITMNTYQNVDDPDTRKILDTWLERRLGQGESIAVIARSGQDVVKLFNYLNEKYGNRYSVENITSQRRSDITILSQLGSNLNSFLPQKLSGWDEFVQDFRAENIRINAAAQGGRRYAKNGPQINSLTLEWLDARQPEAHDIISRLNDPVRRPGEIRRLQLSLLDLQTEKNSLLQRIMDARNARLKELSADIVVCTVHGVKGLEYDHVACFISTEAAGRGSASSSDENRRIAYVALTRARKSECVFCTREKLLKDFAAYRNAQP